MFEPYYDSYAACTAMAGAQRRVVQLRAPDWSFDPEALESAITDRTRLILVNTPHNPTGKVFSRAELEVIAEACRRHDLIAVTDEVYEHLVYESAAHLARDASRHGGANHHDLVCREDLLRHRVEGRVGVRSSRAHRRDPNGEAVPHLRQRRAVPVRDRRGAQRERRLPRRGRSSTPRKARPARGGARGRGISRSSRPAARSFSRPTSRRYRTRTATRSAWRFPSGAASSRSRARSSTTTRARAGTSCDGCSPSAARCSRKRSSASGGCDDGSPRS